jgi:hypothetical protein
MNRYPKSEAGNTQAFTKKLLRLRIVKRSMDVATNEMQNVSECNNLLMIGFEFGLSLVTACDDFVSLQFSSLKRGIELIENENSEVLSNGNEC